jgi:hypothetical protein
VSRKIRSSMVFPSSRRWLPAHPISPAMNLLKAVCACALLAAVTGCGGHSTASVATATPTPMPSVVVSPSSAVVALSASQGFTATGPNGTSVAVNWSLSAPIGTLQPSGSTATYTAPSSFPSPHSVTVTATLQSDASKIAAAGVSVVFPNDNHGLQIAPVKMGTSGGNVTDTSGNFCCSGTLGALITRGGVTYILSDNHVLAKSDNGTAKTTDIVSQPGLVDNNCLPGANTVAHFSAAAALKPINGTNGPAPSNVDAAIAQIVASTVDTSGSILDLGAASGSSIAAAPPSSTLAIPSAVLAGNEGVAKSGRSTGLTCSTLQAINVTVSVDYFSACGGAKSFTSTFSNQVIVVGGSFSAGGDSGALVVTSDTARPLALLYGGNSTSTSANPLGDVITAFTNASGTPAIVGGGDHSVSCDPTAIAPGAGRGSGAFAAISQSEQQRASAARQKHAARLMQDPAVSSVEAGVSEDSPSEGAVVINLSGAPRTAIPQTLDGVRTRVVFPGNHMPLLSMADLDQATAVKESHAGLMAQPGVQGMGVGRSSDNPAETAIVIYVLAGQPHPPIPALLDGVRTKIVEGDRFRAFGWGKEKAPSATSCRK